jgi:hypothetical protein
LGCEEVVHGVLEGFQQPSSENFVCSLCPKGGNFLKSRHYQASMITRPRHGDNWKLYYVPYLMEWTTTHYLLWGPHSDFSKCGSYFCRTLYLTKSTGYEDPPCAASSNLLSLHLSSVQMFSSSLLSNTHTVFLP